MMINFSMLRARPLTLFISSVMLLVSGCAMIDFRGKTPVCFAPGTVAQVKKCFYILEITEKISDVAVRAKVPEAVLKHNAIHGSYTALGGIIGSEVNKDHYGDAEYEFNVENPKQISLERTRVYEFRSIKGKTSLEVKREFKNESEYPKDNGPDQGKNPDVLDPDLLTSAGTELYASHKPKCCMCGTCQSGCYCPGQGGCPWCATTDVQTLITNVSINNATVAIRSGRGSERSNTNSEEVAERVLALMSGSRAQGNISVKSIANYAYDQRFAPACLTKRV